MKSIERIYPGVPPLSGNDAETRARATLQQMWIKQMGEHYETTNHTPSRLLYEWLEKRGANDGALARCGYRLLGGEEDNLKGYDRIASGPGDFGNHWFDHTRVLRWKKDGRLFVMAEPYHVDNAGLAQLAEMARLGLDVMIDGESGWNPGRTMLILIGENAEDSG